jgi:hypothetical protein
MAPDLSVVIASVNGWGVLAPTLRALDELPERTRMQVVVVDSVGGETLTRLHAHRPRVDVVLAGARLAIPRMRHLGIQQARAPLVAILEDHGVVDRCWASEIFRAHREEWAAVGGPVENGLSGLVNWAAFFCEYARYTTPLVEGPSQDLPGNNIAYKRPDLMRHADVLAEGKWESWINANLRADGRHLAATNGMVVRHIKRFRLADFLIQRFHFSRSFAGMRRTEQGWRARIAYGVGCLVLPPLLFARAARSVLQKGRHRALFVVCSPLLMSFFLVGAIGEMAGYLFGPGSSLEKVE